MNCELNYHDQKIRQTLFSIYNCSQPLRISRMQHKISFLADWITMIRKIRRALMLDIRKHWTAVSSRPYLVSSVYRYVHHWRSILRPQIAEPKLYNWANSPYRTQVRPNQLVMVIARPINLNESCKLHLYSLQRTRSPPGPGLPKRIRNTHPRSYYDLKSKDIDVYLIIIIWSQAFLYWFSGRYICSIDRILKRFTPLMNPKCLPIK